MIDHSIVVTESSTVLWELNRNSLNTLQTSWLPVEINSCFMLLSRQIASGKLTDIWHVEELVSRKKTGWIKSPICQGMVRIDMEEIMS